MPYKKHFTLIETVMIIVILAILAVIAVQKYIDLSERAGVAAEKAVVAAVKEVIVNYYTNSCVKGNCSYPPYLENIVSSRRTKCTATNPCFTAVLSPPVTDDKWCHSGGGQFYYYASPRKRFWTYEETTGEFADYCEAAYSGDCPAAFVASFACP